MLEARKNDYMEKNIILINYFIKNIKRSSFEQN